MGVIETGTIVARAEAEAEVRVQVRTTKVIVEQEMMISAGAGARVGAKAEAEAGVEATHTIGASISFRNSFIWIFYMLATSNLMYFNSASPARRSASPHNCKSSPPRRSPTPEKHTNGKDFPPSRSVSPSPKHAGSGSPGSESKVRLMPNCWLCGFAPMHLFSI